MSAEHCEAHALNSVVEVLELIYIVLYAAAGHPDIAASDRIACKQIVLPEAYGVACRVSEYCDELERLAAEIDRVSVVYQSDLRYVSRI